MIGRPLIRLASAPSTMDLASALVQRGATSGTVVVAGHQTAGRGRAGRTWRDQPGEALLLSIIHETRCDPASLGALSPLLGLAIAHAVDHWLPGVARVKWPNDVLLGDRKIAGVLVVSRLRPGRPGATLVIGIGLNVANTAEALPEAATSLTLETGLDLVPEGALDVVLASTGRMLDAFERGEPGPMLASLGLRLAFSGERVQVLDAWRQVTGRLTGVDRDGALILAQDDGTTARVIAGDLTRGPAPIARPPNP